MLFGARYESFASEVILKGFAAVVVRAWAALAVVAQDAALNVPSTRDD
jgi:hypothetical protein